MRSNKTLTGSHGQIMMKNYTLSYKPYGNSAILVQWPDEISEEILNDMLCFQEALPDVLKEFNYEIVPSYNSVLIDFRGVPINIPETLSRLKRAYTERLPAQRSEKNIIHIPVCYDLPFAPDIEDLARHKELSPGEVAGLHADTLYTVYFIGFLPGFMYLGGLDKALHHPRKDTPRLRIDKGAVGIAGAQTGVYPCESPGGWNIIGNSPISFFEPADTPPFFAGPGDKIKFYPVSTMEHKSIASAVAAGEYILKKEECND